MGIKSANASVKKYDFETFMRKFEKVVGQLTIEEGYKLYTEKKCIFVNSKPKQGAKEFSSFYCFNERDYSALNLVLSDISKKISALRKGSLERADKMDKVEEIMRGVIYEVESDPESAVFISNYYYKKFIKPYIKKIYDYYTKNEFDANECKKMYLQAHNDILKHKVFGQFVDSNYIINNFLTFNTAFQFVFEYAYSKRYTEKTKEDFLKLIFNTYELESGHANQGFRSHNVRIRKGNWTPVDGAQVGKSMDILSDWYANSRDAKSLNPIELACIIHCELVRMQPFSDGNHRLARLVANETLIEADFPSVSIPFNLRDEYNKATNKAIEEHDIDDLIDIYYEQVYKNALKINKCLDKEEKKQENQDRKRENEGAEMQL